MVPFLYLVSAKVPHNGRESATLSMAAHALAAFAASAASSGGGGIIGVIIKHLVQLV